MKKIKKGNKEHLIILIVAISIMGIILYPIFDLILARCITNSSFVYSIHSHIIQPIIFGCTTGTVFWIAEK
ncbi:MAG: hypothetical protein IJI58_00420 [Bacilli bacterium]|nr:hypothetical protein [Bacilli bacterium]